MYWSETIRMRINAMPYIENAWKIDIKSDIFPMNSNSGQVVFDACELRFWHLKVSLDRCSRHSRCDSILRWTQTNETKLVWSDVKAANKHAASLCLSHWHTAFVSLVCSCVTFLTIVYFVPFFPTHIDINNKSIH